MPKADALREAKLWLRSLTAKDVRQQLKLDSDAQWQQFASERGLDVTETVASPTFEVTSSTPS